MEQLRNQAYGFLRWTEKYFKTDMVYAASGGFWLFLSKIASTLLGLGTAYVFANYFDPEKYGNYKYILTLVGIAGIFSLSGIGYAVSRSVARGFEGSFLSGVRFAFAWSVPMVVVLFGGAGYYFLNGNLTLGAGLLIAGGFAPAIASWSLYSSYLGGKQKYNLQAMLSIMRNALIPLMVLPALFFTKEPAVLATLYFFATALGVWLSYKTTLALCKPNEREDETLFHHAKHLSIMSVLDTFAAQVDRVLAFSQIGATALAVYSFAQLGPQQFRDLAGIISNLAFPKMSKKTFAELKKVLPEKSLLLFALAVTLSGAYILAAPFMFRIFFPTYMASVPYSQVMTLSILVILPALLFNQALITHKKNKELYILKTATPLLRITLMLVLLPLWGLWGLVWATVVSYSVSFCVMLYLFFTAEDGTDSQEKPDADFLETGNAG